MAAETGPLPGSSQSSKPILTHQVFPGSPRSAVRGPLPRCQSDPLLAGNAKPVWPVAGHIYPDHFVAVIASRSLPDACRSRKTGRRQLVETVRRGGVCVLTDLVMPQDVQRCMPPVAGPGWDRRQGIVPVGRHIGCLIREFAGAIFSLGWKQPLLGRRFTTEPPRRSQPGSRISRSEPLPRSAEPSGA